VLNNLPKCAAHDFVKINKAVKITAGTSEKVVCLLFIISNDTLSEVFSKAMLCYLFQILKN